MLNFKNILSHTKFAPDKMQKVNLFETENFFCDIYCLEPGQEQPAHFHKGADKVYFVIEGRGSFQVGDEVKLMGKNEICHAASGLIHGVKNTNDERLVLLVFMAPSPNV